MEQDLQLLREIQEWDREIYLLRGALEEIPSELGELNRVCEIAKSELARLQEDLKGLQLKQKEKEMELSTKEQNIKKYETQLTQVKTNKEYASLQSEIVSLKADNSLLEEAIINLIDQVEGLQSRMDAQRKKLSQCESSLQEKKTELDQKGKEIEQKIGTLQGQKREKIKAVNPEVATLYERIVTKKRGLAMVKLDDEVCPACQIQLRPQVVNEVKMKERIILCDNCSRILYTD